MNLLRLSVLFSMIDRYLTQILVVGTTAIMARLLTPAETGLFLVAQAVILLAENVRDFGVGAYIVQERDLGQSELRAAFTVTLMLSMGVGIAILLGSGEIAAFYGEPALAPMLAVATLSFLIIPFGSPAIALLRREMQFRTLAVLNVVAALVNAVVTVLMGLTGFGAMSYVWGYVASGMLLALLAVRARPEPGMFRPSLKGARGVMSFGSVSVLVTVANMAYDLLPRLALGRILGFDAVGLYGRALTVCQLPDRVIVSGLQPVVLPAMAAHARSGGELKEPWLRGHALMSGVQWPALLMLALLADPVVQVLLGSQWGAAPPLVRVMALATMALAPAFMTYPLLVAAGRVRDTLWSSLISLPPSVLIVLIAAPHGLDAVAASLLIAAPLQMLVALLFIRRAVGLGFAEVARASLRSLAVTVMTGLLPAVIIVMSPSGFALGWMQSVAALLGAALGWGLGLWLTDHPLYGEVKGGVGHALRRLRGRRVAA